MSHISISSDESYWNEKATELAYLSALQNSRPVISPELNQLSLHERAQATVGTVNFDELLCEIGVDTSYTSLTKEQTAIAVGMGIFGVLLANYTNGKSGNLAAFFEDVHSHFKADRNRCSPLDFRPGKNHRYVFGHDFNILQRLPADYTFCNQSVGGKPLYLLVFEQIQQTFPNSGFIGGHVKAIAHILTHYVSDLPTTDGLPLPFSSFFTEWVKDETKVTGYSAKNPLMDALGKEYGTINFADVASYVVIKMLLWGHHRIAFRDVVASDRDKGLHHAQMSTIAYGTAIIIQMTLLCFGQAGRTGKLNYLIAGPFLWNAGKSVLISQQRHRDVVLDYHRSCAMLDRKISTFDEWVKLECT